MKIIEALKESEDLKRQVASLTSKISTECAILSHETPKYGSDQQKTIAGWIQGAHDRVKRIEELRLAINYTNMVTPVTLEVGNNNVTKSIASWILRRRDLCALDASVWNRVGDRNLREGQIQLSNGDKQEVTITRFYSPTERDEMVEQYSAEPTIIDSRLEVMNAVTDLVDPPDLG
jgi:hypothetical protein